MSNIDTNKFQSKSEESANKFIVKCLHFASFIFLAIWILTFTGVFGIDKTLTSIACCSCLVLCNMPGVLLHIVDPSKIWVKYVITSCLLLCCFLLCSLLTYHATLCIIIPLVFAVAYRNKKFVYITYAETMVVLYFSSILGFYYGNADLNYLFLSNGTNDVFLNSASYVDGANPTFTLVVTGLRIFINNKPWLYLFLYSFLPKSVALFITVIILRHVIDTYIENEIKINELQKDYEIDNSTRFYNKNKYDEMIDTYYRKVENIGVIFWDIDNLKTINDTYGHTQGDIIISIFAKCIYSLTDNMRKAYRIGGDEFVMIIENPREDEINDIIGEFKKMINITNMTSRIQISSGVGYSQGKGEYAREIVTQADNNMYKNKKDFKDSHISMSDDVLNDPIFNIFSSISSNVYTFICDTDTMISRWSKNAVEYFDLPSEYMSDVMKYWKPRVHPDERKEYVEDIRRIFSGESDTHKFEYRALNKYGVYVWLECRGKVLYDDKHKKRIFAGFIVRLDEKSKYDSLTKMQNFSAFSCLNLDNSKGTLLLIGLDDFRKVVNNFGYSFGDVVISEFASKVLEFCGTNILAYRLEGDEFLLNIPNGTEEETLQVFKDLKVLGLNLGKESKHSVNISFSGGAVSYPKDGNSRSVLMANLEHSFEQSKSQKRGGLVFFSESIAKSHMNEFKIRESVLRAIQNDFEGFKFNYQPLVKVESGLISSCEVLLRYEDYEDKGIGISEVIKVLEETGEIIQVGKYVLRESFKKAKEWQAKYPDLSIGVNVSMMQFSEISFVDYIKDLAQKYNINTNKIVIELTESSNIEDYYSVETSLAKLRSFGFRIALDDFGIAYSTLLLIKVLPVDFVKIDHQFVLNLANNSSSKDLAIIESVISLCKTLNIKVVAEGVETKQIVDILSKYPISLFQGYYYSKPLTAENFEKLLDNQKANVN